MSIERLDPMAFNLVNLRLSKFSVKLDSNVLLRIQIKAVRVKWHIYGYN